MSQLEQVGQEGQDFTAHFAVAAVSNPDMPAAALCGVARAFLSVDFTVAPETCTLNPKPRTLNPKPEP